MGMEWVWGSSGFRPHASLGGMHVDTLEPTAGFHSCRIYDKGGCTALWGGGTRVREQAGCNSRECFKGMVNCCSMSLHWLPWDALLPAQRSSERETERTTQRRGDYFLAYVKGVDAYLI